MTMKSSAFELMDMSDSFSSKEDIMEFQSATDSSSDDDIKRDVEISSSDDEFP